MLCFTRIFYAIIKIIKRKFFIIFPNASTNEKITDCKNIKRMSVFKIFFIVPGSSFNLVKI